MTELTDMRARQLIGKSRAIAIIGIGCRYPGANGPDQLWEVLRNAEDMTSKVPADRFDVDALHAPVHRPGKLFGYRAGFLEHVDQFDAKFFGLAKNEAVQLDPQQRLLMMATWEALEDAGLAPEKISGTRVGVYVGFTHTDYAEQQYRRGLEALVPSDIKNARSMLSGRLSYTFDLRGPSVSIDTACTGSLVAVHLACLSLRAGETTLALACGVNLKLLPDDDVLLSQARMIAPDGRCKFGDASANGLCCSDGAGVVVLKPLARALADGDRVRAVILGSAVSNDGASGGALLQPAVEGQIQTLRWAYQDAGISPAEVDFVEAHGTGTPLIDPLEFAAFGEVFGKDRSAEDPLLVGSIKTNVGHSEGAAGIAGMIKATLCLEHRQVPPSLHFRDPNPKIPWDKLPVVVPTTMQPLPDRGRLALAGVNGQGLSAVNAHVVLEEADPTWNAVPLPDIRPRLFVMSARTSKALHDLARLYLAYLEAPGPGATFHLRDICYSAIHRRQHHSYRFAKVIRDQRALINALRDFLKEESTNQVDLNPNVPEGDLQVIMNIVLWIVQALLALAFLLAGFIGASQPIAWLGQRMNWMNHFPASFVRLVSILEVLGAFGLILPGLTRILPMLTPIAAVCLALTMIGAVFVHIRLKEYSAIVPPAVLLILFLFIAYGRFVLVPLS